MKHAHSDPTTELETYEMGDLQPWDRLAERAYAEETYVDHGWRFEHSDGDSNGVTTRAVSSARDRFYVVRLVATSEGIFLGCECPAGQHAKPCKHVARLLVEEGVIDRPPRVTSELGQKAAGLLLSKEVRT